MCLEKEIQYQGRLIKRSSFFDCKLNSSRRYIFVLIIVVGIINLLMLIPDMELIENASARLGIAIMRIIYTFILLIVALRVKSITSFRVLSYIVSLCELIAVGIFLFVFSKYGHPSFLIQAMGLIILVLSIFLIPNRWVYMLSVSLLSAIGFFICASFFVGSIDKTQYAAAVTYVSISILLCAVSAINADRHQFSEFLARTELKRISTTDFLTETANRLKMSEEAKRWIAFCKRQSLPLSLIFFDVDNLKSINDRYGHSAGDNLLAGLAKLTQRQLRSSDVLARWGGDEFVLLLPNVSLDNAVILVGRIENSIKENMTIEGDKITCSFGVVEMKGDSTFETLISEADILMYSAKQRGKDNVEFAR